MLASSVHIAVLLITACQRTIPITPISIELLASCTAWAWKRAHTFAKFYP